MLAGLGYRYKRAQLQVNYSWGQASLAVDYSLKGQRLGNPTYTNRAFQASLGYLLPLQH